MKSLILKLVTTATVSVACLVSSLSATSQESTFTIASRLGNKLSISSLLLPLQINRIHSWEIELRNANGSPIEGASIEVIGGMPAHDHGLPTQPQVTASTDPGIYLVEGIRFHMPGDWEMTFSISVNNQSDTAVLEFSL